MGKKEIPIHEFRLFDFQVFNKTIGDDEDKETNFEIQMFGINEQGKSCCIFVEEYTPFFYIKIGNHWTPQNINAYKNFIKYKVGKFFAQQIEDIQLVFRKQLYGFDGGQKHKFLEIKFQNTMAYNRVKYLFKKNRCYDRKTLEFLKYDTELYEANIPPLLRYFHIQNISPSGWVQVKSFESIEKTTTCDYEFVLSFNKILPLNEKETPVPYKICSFDIEASSSHGDFPVPIKDYKKLAVDMIAYIDTITSAWNQYGENTKKQLMSDMIYEAFGIKPNKRVDIVYPKKKVTKEKLSAIFPKLFTTKLEEVYVKEEKKERFSKRDEEEDEDEDEKAKRLNLETFLELNVLEMLENNPTHDEQVVFLTMYLSVLPDLEGDKVTFIGSTFMNYGQKETYKNNIIVLDSCSKMDNVENAEIETYETEKDVLLAWQKLIQRENPDIITGYNIFGFDYSFMFKRAQENNCVEQFLELSRNEDEICGEMENDGTYKIDETKIVIASGEHDLCFIKMAGRIQVDLYNYLRRDYNLPSYKLDYVAGQFIGDNIIKIEHGENDDEKPITTIFTKNMMGVHEGTYIHFEEISHSSDYYKQGAKFIIRSMNKETRSFVIDNHEHLNMKKKVRWGLAKDDVTPQDIFRLANQGPDERALVAKYCIQDCNLVHYLMNKIDVITGFIEMANICSVPIDFLVMRGQGIKLTSFIAKKCREKETLIPVLEKPDYGDPVENEQWNGYDGAIVLDPKCGLYLDNPVACVDYASLYPSSMISENLSHDSKVWVKEYDLNDRLIKQEGVRDASGNYVYDSMTGYKYVDIKYDTYSWRKNERGKLEKIVSGYRICRWAQFPNNGKGIMPSILEDLLAARKSTRELIPQQSDDFMKNVLDKRQLSYKITANSLYGQCGAKTSTFFEKDVAASTTATGRLLLTYAKAVIEKAYGGGRICDTKIGKVKTFAEYIYGDTDSVFFTFNLETLDGVKIRGKDALIATIELAIEAGELSTKFLKKPHDLEYEKTFMPFCLLSKKRYVGMLYETDVNKCSQKSMGIVLKRRDNAAIVKDVYGGIIDILMKEQNVVQSVEFLKKMLQDLVDGKVAMDKLLISKSLRSHYKNPKQIAHKVLADRIGARDPGNKPSAGDRIPFAYIVHNDKRALQGEKIEHPNYISSNNVALDYEFYITNQIMKPIQQLFALILEQIPDYKRKPLTMKKMKDVMASYDKEYSGETLMKKREAYRSSEVKKVLFDPFLQKLLRQKNNTITNFFQPR
uniref:DNA-directed DNA polymerase n=1 Tax=viral metagenome TaxID=1070528 RepID=A0A6C0EM08_9ZZZZ